MPPLPPESVEDYSEEEVESSTPSERGKAQVNIVIRMAAKQARDSSEEPDTPSGHPEIAKTEDTGDSLVEPSDIDSREESEVEDQEADIEMEQSQGAEVVQTPTETGDDEESGQEDSGIEEEKSFDAVEEGDEEASEDNQEEDAESEEEQEEFEAAESGSEESGDADDSSKNCMYCKQSEDDDPAEEFEQYLTCTSCSKHAHGQCARENNAFKEGDDAEKWSCRDCTQAQTTTPESVRENARQRSSAPRLVRDLLPVSRGVQKPDSHSIFAQPLMSDGDEDGRRLRKRKSPTGELAPVSEKRRRKATPRVLEAQTPSASAVVETRIPDSAVVHSTRRASTRTVPLVRIIQQRPFNKPPPHKFILAFHLEQTKIEAILSRPPKPGRKRDRKKPPKIPPPPIFHAPIPKFPALPAGHLIFPSVFTEREHDLNNKPYGGILSETEGDTTRSLPQLRDREIFEIARKEAEEERRRTSEAAEAQLGADSTATASKRTVSGPPSKIKCIQFGKHVIDTFYAAPYPEEYSHESRLFICEFCLKYLPSEFVAYRHKLKCPAKHPPGDEIYRDGSISIWEVDGRKKTEYCQCLCLMAKMFLGSKTLYYDVEPFLFYILTEYDEYGYHFVGYFSKEKRPASLNNVSCILVMPIHQRKGYAMYLIDFSYLLTRIEGKEGSPEKPLSDMGLTAYRSYWDLTMSRHLLALGLKPFSTKTLMERTGMTADDVIHTLERLYAFVKDPVTKTYAIRFDRKLYENIVSSYDAKKHRGVKPEMLVWTPYVMGRSDAATLDGNPMQTVAQREEDSDEEADAMEVEQPDVNGKNGDGEHGSDVEMADAGESKIDQSKESGSEKAKSRQSSTHVNGDEIAEDADVTIPTSAAGQVAPGPPSTAGIEAAVSTEFAEATSALTEQVNGARSSPTKGKLASNEPFSKDADDEEELSGYALAFRANSIPPQRFQIDPPIPPSMLRNNRSVKRKGFTRQRSGLAINGDGTDTPNTTTTIAAATAVRSSPRHASSVAGVATNEHGNGNGSSVDGLSPEKAGPATPIRRSGRRSGLIHELMSLDGASDVKTPRKGTSEKSSDEEDEEDEEEEEEGGEEISDEGEDEEEDGESSSSESGEEPGLEAEEEEDEEDDDDDDNDPEIVVQTGDDEEDDDDESGSGEEEEESSSEDADVAAEAAELQDGEDESGEDDDDDGDEEVEVEEEEDDDDEEDEEEEDDDE